MSPFKSCRWLTDNPPEHLLHGVPPDVLQAFVVGSAFIFEATRDALEVAKGTGRTVAFLFNTKLVVVRPRDDSDAVARAWWQEVNGETPEESWARR